MIRAVTTTGIYCVARCPARPKPENVRHFATLADARAAGFRACKRCGPDEAELELALPHRAPLDAAGLIAFLGRRAVPGVEEVVDGAYRRSLRLRTAPGIVELRASGGEVRARFWLDDPRDRDGRSSAAARCSTSTPIPLPWRRRSAPTRCSATLVRATPGRRVPGHADAHELAFRAVLGQQVSLAGAASAAARLTAAHGEPLAVPLGAITHLFPTAEALAGADGGDWPMPRAPGRGPAGPRRRAGLRSALARPRRRPRGGRAGGSGSSRASARGPWRTWRCARCATRTRSCPATSACATRSSALGADGSPRPAEAALRGVAPVPGLCGPAPVGEPRDDRPLGEACGMSATVYTRMDSPIGELLLAGDGHALSLLHMMEGRHPVRVGSDWRRDDDAFAGARARSSASTSRAGAPASTCRWRSTARRSSCACGGRCSRSPTARPQLRRAGTPDREPARRARRGPGERPQPDRGDRALPPRDRRRRHAHRVRRRPRAQAIAARARVAPARAGDVLEDLRSSAACS